VKPETPNLKCGFVTRVARQRRFTHHAPRTTVSDFGFRISGLAILPPPVTRSDEEPIAAGGWYFNFGSEAPGQDEIRNPKPEIRCLKSEFRQVTLKPPAGRWKRSCARLGIRISDFGFVSDFGFRISDLDPGRAEPIPGRGKGADRQA